MYLRRYEKEWTHPVKNLFGGELAYAMLIQVSSLDSILDASNIPLHDISYSHLQL